jgi:hypothetical protein
MSAGEWRWVEGAVDQRGEHLRIAHVDADSLVAVVGPPHDRAFTVQFLIPNSGTESVQRILGEVRRELDYYLVELGEPDPWAYAHYHCGTMSNAMSRVQWGSCPAGLAEGDTGWQGIPTVYLQGDPFDRDGLDTVVVAAGAAWGFYRRHSAYVCQPGRSFRPVERIGFYRHKRIEPRLPEILDRRDHVPFTREHAEELRATGLELDAHLARVILDSLSEGSRHEGDLHEVFLLTSPEDSRTIGLTSPIPHDRPGAWTMGQRYASSSHLVIAKTTRDLEPEAPPPPLVLHSEPPARAPLSNQPSPGEAGHAYRTATATTADATLQRCFVQFMHPGGEHGPDRGSLKSWNVGDHKRKFLRLPGESLASASSDAVGRRHELVFWGEWEPESDVEPIDAPIALGPRWLHLPFYVRPEAFRRDGKVLQNTDPFVYGDRFLYTLCRQWRNTRGVYGPTFLRDLAVGSLILFGSHKQGDFVLDTVFVVGGSSLHDASSWERAIAGRVPEAYADVTLRPTYEHDGGEELRLYLGATPTDRVDGMFSFVPCKRANDGAAGFARPTIRLDGLITADLKMGAKATKDPSPREMHDIWVEVVDQVLGQELELGTHFNVPERRDGSAIRPRTGASSQ